MAPIGPAGRCGAGMRVDGDSGTDVAAGDGGCGSALGFGEFTGMCTDTGAMARVRGTSGMGGGDHLQYNGYDPYAF